MPINLDTFRQNITSDMKGVILNANGDGFTKAAERKNAQGENVVSGFQRFFNTSARQQLSLDLLQTFRNALVQEFGTTNADQALRKEFGDKTLNAMIRNDVDLARIAKVSGAKILAALKHAELLGAGVDVGNVSERGKRLLNTNPTTRAECTAMKAEINRLLSSGPVALDTDLRSKFEAKLGELEKLSFSELKVDQLDKQIKIYKQAALNVLLRESNLHDDYGKAQITNHFESFVSSSLTNMFDSLKLTANNGVIEKLPKKNGLTKDFIKNLAANLEAMVKTAFATFDSFSITLPKNFAAKIKAERASIMNSKEWSTIKKDFNTSFNGNPVSLTSIQKPASNIEGGGIKASYQAHGMGGVICHDTTEKRHAANMAETSFSINVDGKPKELFKGIRHGVNSARGIKKDAERTEANTNRAAETAKANFFARPDAVKKLINAGDGSSIEFDLTSISLLTATSSGERKMLNEQTKAWESLGRLNEGRGIEIQYEGKTVYLKPKPTIIGLGVDYFSSSSLGSILGNGIREGSFNFKDDTGFINLARRVDTFLSSCPANDAKVPVIRKLMDQILSLMSDSSLSRNDKAYAAVSRMAVVSYLMGDPPCFNCKSGKDRTSSMDTECKFLVAMIELKGTVPEPGVKLNAEETHLYREIASHGGNRELQEYNTGYQGTKSMEHVGDVVNKTGEDFNETLKGYSGLTGS